MTHGKNRPGRSTGRGAAALALALVLTQAAGAAEAPADCPAETGRLVSIGGAVTEIVYALGMEACLVAVDSTSIYPPEARDLPDLGYMRQLSAEPILAEEPNLVLAVEDSGPPQVLAQLREAGLHVEIVDDVPTAEGVIDKVLAVGRALGRADKADALAADLRARFAALGDRGGIAEDAPRVLFLLSTGNGGLLAAGRDTSAGGIIALAGARNAITDFEGFKPLTAEAAVTADPDFILIPDRMAAEGAGIDGVAAIPALANTRAAREKRIIAMDGLLLLGFGPRTPDAALALSRAVHTPGG